MEKNPLWRNITDLFRGKVSAFDLQPAFSASGRNLTIDELKRYNENINAITRIIERDFPEQTIPIKANIREAIDIFYKVNASGVALTDAELALGVCAAEERRHYISTLSAVYPQHTVDLMA